METKRTRYLDVTRGIAIISVVLGHLNNFAICRVVFTYHLPIFYLISGYFLESRLAIPVFIRKKARRLLVPYYVSCLALIPCYMLRNLALGHDPLARFRDIIVEILYAAGDNWSKPFSIKAVGPLWFLWALFWGELMLRLLLKCKAGVRIAVVAAIFAVSCWSWRLIWLPLSIQAGGCALLFIYLGHLLRQCLPTLTARPISGEVKAAGTVLALAMWLWMVRNFTAFWLVHCEIGHGMADVLGSVSGCAILVLVSRAVDVRLDGVAKLLAFLGRYSLLMLVLHFLETQCIPWKVLFKDCATRFGLSNSPDLYLWFRIILKMVLLTGMTALLSRVPLVRRIYGYPPLKTEAPQDRA